MDPITAFVAANAGALAVAGGGLGVASSIMQGNQQASSLKQQAAASEKNAQISDLQARQAYDAGLQNELAQRRSSGQQQSDVRAAVAESGFDATSGTALAIQQQSARDMEMDALNTRYQALLQGYGHERQADMDRYTAKTLRKSARGARRAGYIGAATSALTAAAGYGLAKGAPAAAAAGGGSSGVTLYGVQPGSGVGLRVAF